MFARRVRKHRFNGRLANGAADTLGEHESASYLPTSSQSHRRNGEEIDGVANEGDRPVPASAISYVSRDRTQAVPEELTDTGDDTDGCGTRSKRSEKLAVDARTAFIGRVGEEIHHPHHQHEPEGGRSGHSAASRGRGHSRARRTNHERRR